jgi:hypothetical protein
MIAGHLALLVSACFTGAAFYINLVEQPARLKLDDRAQVLEWKTAYKRSYAVQAPLAVLGFAFGMLAWYQTKQLPFLLGAVLMIANWPWTLIVIKPVNDVLMATPADNAGAATRALIMKWNALHLVRSLLGGAAAMSFLYGLSAK